MKINIDASTKDQISICQQFLGYKFNYYYFDTAESLLQLPINPLVPADPVVIRANVDFNNFMTNDVILETNEEL